jgi:hypothetical protein
MVDLNAHPVVPRLDESDSPDASRKCVACGYILYGLGDEPRCPECGLLNVPEGYRRQVWGLVDSRTWFFSSLFGVLKKRPPGWWWSLDRDGDVRRSIRFASAMVAVSTLMIVAGFLVAASVHVQLTMRSGYNNSWAITPPDGIKKFTVVESTYSILVSGILKDAGKTEWETDKPVVVVDTISVRFGRPSGAGLQCVAILLASLLSWAGPAGIGLWTQIRKGLPSFARAPRTIIAASMYESHRLVYVALLVWVGLLIDGLVRSQIASNTLEVCAFTTLALVGSLILFAASGWIGPLRSDYTRQLIRSRKHSARILAMYAIGLPLIGVFVMVVVGTIAEL